MEGITTKLTDKEINKACSLAEEAYNESIVGAIKFESRLGATAFYLKSNGKQYVVFRGTNGDAGDWLMNLSAFPWRVNGRWVHGGFAAAQNSVWKPIRKLLEPSTPIYFIGHSLGGACATVSALRLTKRSTFKDVNLITFGRPNVMLKSKKTMEGIKNISVVAASDIVSLVPKFFYGADKNQDIIYMGSNNKNYLNPTKKFRDGDRKLGNSIKDHMMETSYSPRVKNLKVEKLICD
jgi:hypothetical protein